eukprot:3680936-Rhodomonas_salina.1
MGVPEGKAKSSGTYGLQRNLKSSCMPCTPSTHPDPPVLKRLGSYAHARFTKTPSSCFRMKCAMRGTEIAYQPKHVPY